MLLVTCIACRVGVITDPPLQESVSDPQTLLDALEEPVAEPLTLTSTNADASVSVVFKKLLFHASLLSCTLVDAMWGVGRKPSYIVFDSVQSS